MALNRKNTLKDWKNLCTSCPELGIPASSKGKEGIKGKAKGRNKLLDQEAGKRGSTKA